MFGMFGMFEIMFFIVFFLVMGVIIVTLVRGISQWNKNNHSPRLTVSARIVAKRTNVSVHHNNAGGTMLHHRTTTYFVTFEVDSGDRMELRVAGHEYGLLIEGDQGNMSFQGTRFLGFERT